VPNFWSNPDLARASNYVTFETTKDTVTGVVTALRTQTFVDNGVTKTVAQLDLATADGPRTLTAGPIRLQLALLEHRPQIGDEITITLTGVERRPGGKTLKSFDVRVARGSTGEIVETPQPAAPDALL
jgi:hypothetical protein